MSWSIQAIWENYAGWFHHESTTELYCVPQRSIHPDLIELAGGPERIVERAKGKLSAGEPVPALHLLDILLSQPNPPDVALDVAIEAHELLEADSVNFWLSAWLRNQIEKLDGRRSESARS